MAKRSTKSGKLNLGTGSTVSRTSKPKTYAVSHPLTPSRISWLRLQSRRVAAASGQFLEQRDSR